MKTYSFYRNLFITLLILMCYICACKKETPATPKGIIFKSWSVEGLQATDSDGNAWDDEDDTGPDVKLLIHQNGPTLYESSVIPDMVIGEKYEIDINPDIRFDSLTEWRWELYDEYEPFFEFNTIRSGYVSLIHDYLPPDHITLDGNNPKVILQVEYIY